MSACILCGIDGSREAGRAAAVGARLARDLDARALLIHVDEDARTRRFGVPAPRRAWRKKHLLKATAEECCFPPKTELRLEKGDPTAALLAVAQDEDAELVVVSTGGRGTASPVLLGGTASALMRRCPCPVLVVPTTSVVPLDSDSMHDVIAVVGPPETDEPSSVLNAPVAIRLAAAGSTALVVLPSKAELQVGSGHYELARAP